MRGIDVSKHNGSINFNQVKQSGIDFAIIRLGYGQDMTCQDDIRFEENYQKARAAGLLVGVYIYSYAKTGEMAESEARHCIRLLKGKTIDFPVYYDLEDDSIRRVDWNMLTNRFATVMRNAGYNTAIYTFISILNKLSDETKKKYPIWIAAWGRDNGQESIPNPGYSMWQYTAKGVVHGINGVVDMNILNDTNQVNKPITNTVPSADISIEDLALETLKGKYGDGKTRKATLGNNYKAVQAKINQWYKLAEETKNGKYGNGTTRKKKLGVNYAGVQYVINHGGK